MSTFTIPEAPALVSAISSICTTIYGPSTPVGRHVRAVFKDRQMQLPPLASYDAQTTGLVSALKENPTLFSSTAEFNAFLSNVLWETICLSTLKESCGSSCADPIYYGRGYIQLTGKSNYEAFATFAKRPDIIQNPDLVATDQSLAWSSAFYFWNSASGCKGSTNAGQALLCINRPECAASASQSPVYFQFAPFYRLLMNQMLASSSSSSDISSAAKSACSQMQFDEGKSWQDFCSFHGNTSSPINCQNPLSLSSLPVSSTTLTSSSVSSSVTSTITSTPPPKNAADAQKPRLYVHLLSALAILACAYF